jgi:2-polyprenyl-6-methoxyphenol hydroxylase-like FAD-dependent oxidoreductase
VPLIASSSPPFRVNVFDVAALPRWHRERVVLVGDAAHASSPTSGQGASLALEDAAALARRLRDDEGDHGRAFTGFERERRARVERIVAAARRRGADRAEVTPLRAHARNLALWLGLHLFGEREQDWIYRYRVDWAAAPA